jgi:uncharacterized protein (TIGR03437 family)
LNEALLLVDDPPFPNQVGCVPQLDGSACPVAAGTPASPNIFQGRQIQDSVIAFRQIPINPPGAQSARTLRITNLRANVASLAQQANPQPLQLSVQMFAADGSVIRIQNSTMTSAAAQPGAIFSLRLPGDQALPLAGPALTVSPASLPAGTPREAQSFQVKFTEGFSGAFRRRNIGTSGADPLFTTIQATPGLNYATESGFFNSTLPATTDLNTAGLADSGTRLRVVFQGVPANVLLWVSVRDVPNGTTGYSADNPKALLTTSDANGAGPIDVPVPTSGSYVQVPVSEGTGTAVWEVVGADPTAVEDISFSVAVTGPTPGSAAIPGQGTVMIAGGLAPLTGGTTATIPAFLDVATPLAGVAISNVVAAPQLTLLSAAGLSGSSVSPDSIVSGFGQNLASSVLPAPSLPLPAVLGGTSVDVVDSAGMRRPSPLYLVSPGQVNFLLDPETRAGPGLVRVTNAGTLVASGVIQVDPVAPALFSANASGSGVAAGQLLRSRNGATSMEPIATFDPDAQRWLPVPLDLGTADTLFLTLYGTGIRNRASLADVRATVGGETVPVIYAGPQNGSPGLDQINIGPLPQSLKGRGAADVVVSISGKLSNTVSIQIQ